MTHDTPPHAQKLAELEEAVNTAVENNDPTAEAAALSQQALIYAMQGNLKKAAELVTRVSILAEGAGEYEALAGAQLAKGKALRNVTGEQADAAEALTQAGALYDLLGKNEEAGESQLELARIQLQQGKASQAAKTLAPLAAAPEPSRPKVTALQLLAQVALSQIPPDVAGAVARLEEGIDTAVFLTPPDHQLALQLKVQKQALTRDNIADLLAEADALGVSNVQIELRLRQTSDLLRDKRYQPAAELALQTRRQAREAGYLFSDVHYLAASLLAAEAYNKIHDRVHVLGSLLSCRAYVQDRLGRDMAQQLDLVLDGYANEWGRERMAQVIKSYQQYVAENGPFGV